MSGRKFIEKLIELRYPDAEKLNPRRFDWLFERDPASPILQFLNYFCDRVDSSNYLSDEELRAYEELEKTGRVLDDSELDELIPDLQEKDADSEAKLSLEIEKLKEERDILLRKVDALTHLKTQLSTHVENATKKNAALEVRSRRSKMEASCRHQRAVHQCLDANTLMNSVLQDMKNVNEDVNTILHDFSMKPYNDRFFPSQFPFDDCLSVEVKTIQHIKESMDKLLSQGSEHENSTDLSVNKETLIDKELRRLHSVLCEAEKKRISAEVEKSQSIVRLAKAKEIENSLHEFINQDPVLLKAKEKELELAKQKLRSLTDKVNATIGNSMAFHVYNTKDSFLQKQITAQNQKLHQYNLLLDRLNGQSSRLYVMHSILKCDSDRLNHMLNLLQECANFLSAHQSEHETQMKLLSTEDKRTRDDEIDQSDGNPSTRSKAYVKNLESINLHETVSERVKLLGEHHFQLDDHVRAIEAELWDVDSSRLNPPPLAPKPVLTLFSKLQKEFRLAESATLNIVKAHASRKSALKGASLPVTEKMIFSKFSTDPLVSQQAVEEVEKS